MPDYAERARKAQQQNEQKHDVQLELPDEYDVEREAWEDLLLQSLGTCGTCGHYSSAERCPCGGEIL